MLKKNHQIVAMFIEIVYICKKQFLMETKRKNYGFHSARDLEINHLVVIHESMVLNLALFMFILGQFAFVVSSPLLAETWKIDRSISLFFAHVLSWCGEILLIYNLMRGMIVLKKPLRKLFISVLTTLTLVHFIMGFVNLMGMVNINGIFSIPFYIGCIIPFMVLGYEINHSYYGNLSLTGLLMVFTALANITYLMSHDLLGYNIIILDIICAIIATIYMVVLRMRLVGRENVEDISPLTSNQQEKITNSLGKEIYIRGSKEEIDFNYVISTETKNRMNLAVVLFIIAQVLFFLCAPQIATLLGISRVATAFLSHLIKGLTEAYLIYCLMKGVASLKYPLHRFFTATVVVILVFNLTIAFIILLSHFGIHGILIHVFTPLLIIYIVPYTLLGLFLFQRYYGLISYLGIAMMLYIFTNLLIQGFLLSGITLLYNLILATVSIAYIIFLRKTLVGIDTYEEQKEKEVNA